MHVGKRRAVALEARRATAGAGTRKRGKSQGLGGSDGDIVGSGYNCRNVHDVTMRSRGLSYDREEVRSSPGKGTLDRYPGDGRLLPPPIARPIEMPAKEASLPGLPGPWESVLGSGERAKQLSCEGKPFASATVRKEGYILGEGQTVDQTTEGTLLPPPLACPIETPAKVAGCSDRLGCQCQCPFPRLPSYRAVTKDEGEGHPLTGKGVFDWSPVGERLLLPPIACPIETPAKEAGSSCPSGDWKGISELGNGGPVHHPNMVDSWTEDGADERDLAGELLSIGVAADDRRGTRATGTSGEGQEPASTLSDAVTVDGVAPAKVGAPNDDAPVVAHPPGLRAINPLSPRPQRRRKKGEAKEIRGRLIGGRQPDQITVKGSVRDTGRIGRAVDVELLVDTGAERTFLSEEIYKEHFAHVPLDRVKFRLSAINGSGVSVLGSCELEIRLRSHHFRHEFVVADVGEEAILGVDFLRRYKCHWDWEEEQLHVGNMSISCGVSPELEKATCPIEVTEDREIPAGSEVILLGRIRHPEGAPILGMVEGKRRWGMEKGLLVAHTLVRRRKDVIPLRVMNPGERVKKIRKGEGIAQFQPVEILEAEGEMKIRAAHSPDGPLLEAPRWDDGIRDLCTRGQEQLEGPEARDALTRLLREYQDIFIQEGQPLGRTRLVEHEIDTGEARPIKQRPRREPLGMQDVVKKEIHDMLDKDVIEPSSSAWASPVVLVRKKDGSIRFCIDYRKLNDVSKKDAYPLPRIDDNLDALAGAEWFSTLDLASGYWQVAMKESDREKTAFCTRYGLFQWKVMPFGLCNAPGTFEHLMERVLAGLQWNTILLYLDDIIVFGRTIEEKFQRLTEVFERIRSAGLQLKPKKCHLFKTEVSFLGHRVSKEGVNTEEDKVQAVKEWPTPRGVKDVRAFLGLTGYYRRFVEGYAQIASPLINLTRKGTAFCWEAEQEEAFNGLKQKLISAPILGYPRAEGKFILDTDASQCAIGAVLSQEQDGKETVIAYGSRKLSKAEKNYCVTRKELLAIVWFCEQFKHFLIGHSFLLRTDHHSLKWLFGFKEPEGQIARWLERLASFQFVIEHRAGIKHGNGDGMSRPPCGEDCRYCMRQREKENPPVKSSEGQARRPRTGRTGRQ